MSRDQIENVVLHCLMEASGREPREGAVELSSLEARDAGFLIEDAFHLDTVPLELLEEGGTVAKLVDYLLPFTEGIDDRTDHP